MRHPYIQVNQPMILAHQGFSAIAPPNTFAAFNLAVALGVDALETDVHMTRDGIIVVCHDAQVDAVSDGTGNICDLTYDALRRLDFGYRFTTDGGQTFPFRHQGIRMPTLREVLTRYPQMRINVDLKPPRPDIVSYIREIFACDAERRVLTASFHYRTLQELRSRARGLATSAAPREVFGMMVNALLRRDTAKYAFNAAQVPISMAGIRVITPTFLQHARQARMPVHVWTIDDAATMRRLLDSGVDGIVTNRPDVGLQVRGGLAMMNSPKPSLMNSLEDTCGSVSQKY